VRDPSEQGWLQSRRRPEGSTGGRTGIPEGAEADDRWGPVPVQFERRGDDDRRSGCSGAIVEVMNNDFSEKKIVAVSYRRPRWCPGKAETSTRDGGCATPLFHVAPPSPWR
jgi:hypothetical protein